MQAKAQSAYPDVGVASAVYDRSALDEPVVVLAVARQRLRHSALCALRNWCSPLPSCFPDSRAQGQDRSRLLGCASLGGAHQRDSCCSCKAASGRCCCKRDQCFGAAPQTVPFSGKIALTASNIPSSQYTWPVLLYSGLESVSSTERAAQTDEVNLGWRYPSLSELLPSQQCPLHALSVHLKIASKWH